MNGVTGGIAILKRVDIRTMERREFEGSRKILGLVALPVAISAV